MIRKYRSFTVGLVMILAPAVWAASPGFDPGRVLSNSEQDDEVRYKPAKPIGVPAQHTRYDKTAAINRLKIVASAQANELGNEEVQPNKVSTADGKDSLLLWIVGTLLMSLLMIPRERKHTRQN